MKAQIKYFSGAILLIVLFSSFVKAPVKLKPEVITVQTSAVCEECKARIEKALKSTDGVLMANLDLKDKKIKVKYDPEKTSPTQIRTIISNTGYDADDMKKSPTAFNSLPHCCQKGGAACEKGK
jgi:mercuric ion binding protein